MKLNILAYILYSRHKIHYLMHLFPSVFVMSSKLVFFSEKKFELNETCLFECVQSTIQLKFKTLKASQHIKPNTNGRRKMIKKMYN